MLSTTQPTVHLGPTDVAAITMDDAVRTVMELSESRGRHLVVTPNVDHLVLLERDSEFADAYDKASLRVADGAPLVLLSRLLGTPVPERITGVDLALAVLEEAALARRSVFLFGGSPAVLQGAVEHIRRRWPTLALTGSAAPRVDLNTPTAEEDAALATIREAKPDVLLIFLGAPKQEKWFWRRAGELPPTVGLAVGGTVEVIAGARSRAPRWLQSIGCEWLWRLVQDPRHLARRYLVQDLRFLRTATRQLRSTA
jgi:N-acetylglucosaminyldiphosphoundecaprenol N-acetyl-beta-D-mannosaminyltransferase